MNRPPRPSRPLRRVALALPVLAALAGGAVADPPKKGAPPADSVAAAGSRARATLPAPAEGRGFTFEGDLAVGPENERSGAVKYEVDAGSYHDQPVWLVSESVTDEWGGIRTTSETTLYLAK